MPPDEEEDLEAVARAVLNDEDGYSPPPELINEPSPPSKNLAAEIAALRMGQKLKLALRGNRDVRTILMRDPSVMVQRFLIENPRLTEEEVIAMAKSRTVDAEILGRIAKRQDWLRNYQVRLSLVTNPKTPQAVAMRFVSGLLDRDVRMLAKSRNVPSAVTGAARRIVQGRR
jgi:hypothetical protein